MHCQRILFSIQQHSGKSYILQHSPAWEKRAMLGIFHSYKLLAQCGACFFSETPVIFYCFWCWGSNPQPPMCWTMSPVLLSLGLWFSRMLCFQICSELVGSVLILFSSGCYLPGVLHNTRFSRILWELCAPTQVSVFISWKFCAICLHLESPIIAPSAWQTSTLFYQTVHSGLCQHTIHHRGWTHSWTSTCKGAKWHPACHHVQKLAQHGSKTQMWELKA